MKNVSYFTKNWQLPHLTLTSFSEYDELFSFEKITKDLEDMIAELKDPQFDFHEYLKQAKIKCGWLPLYYSLWKNPDVHSLLKIFREKIL